MSWQRILALHSGVGIYSMAVIVACFMAGLGCGSYLGGRLSARLSRRQALAAFAATELGIALFGAASCAVYYDWLYLEAAWLYRPLARAVLVHLASLLIPTTLMGMSLPLLVRAMVWDVLGASRVVGTLYGLNVVGAAAGSLLAPWFLIRSFGLRGAVEWAALANLAAALGALLLGLSAGFRDEAEAGGEAVVTSAGGGDSEPERPGGRPFGLWLALYALSGACALSLEVIWFRVVDVAVKSTPFTFGTVLAVYLLGLGAGSLIGGPIAGRTQRPLRAFLLTQCALLAYSGAALVLLGGLPATSTLHGWFADYWRGGSGFALGGSWDWPSLLRLYVGVPVVLFGPPTLLMGVSFALLQRAVQDDPRTSGRKAGFLQAANLLGCLVGSLVVGLVLLNWIGTTGAMRFLVACGVAFAAIGLSVYGFRSAFAPAAALLAALVPVLPLQPRFWSRLHGQDGGPALVEEDATGVVAILPEDEGRWRVFVNGRSHSWLPFGGVHTRLGAMPAIVHPSPHDVAIIGLGSGDTAWGAACRPETRRVRVFEIMAPQLRLLRQLAASPTGQAEDLLSLRRLLRDPRVEVHLADGRNALEQGDDRYDVIQADALRPDMAGSGNLYSLEFFTLCARKLKPGGVMCTWAPTQRVVRTFRTAFPHVLRIDGGETLIGSNQPIAVDVPEWAARLDSPQVKAYLGSSVARLVLRHLATAERAEGLRHPRGSPNRDLFPRDEFLSP